MSSLRNVIAGLGALMAATLAVGVVQAAPGYVTASVNLRAGPNASYPVVAVMHAGDLVEIYGCINGFAWCDIDWSNNRGWTDGAYLQMVYQDHRESIITYGGVLGVPFIGFDVDTYWNSYYHDRPFFNKLQRFHGARFTIPGGQPPGGNGPQCGVPGKPACGSQGNAGSGGPKCGVPGKPACGSQGNGAGG